MNPADLAKSGTEHGAQMAIFAWAQQNLVKYPDLKWLFHVPNGDVRTKAAGARLKAGGLKKGVPDIMCLVKRWIYSGLVIELKVGKGKLSVEQSEWLDKLYQEGYCTRLCYGYEAARDEIIKYLEL